MEGALRTLSLQNVWALRPMAEGAPSEREAPDILSECHPLAAALDTWLDMKGKKAIHTNFFFKQSKITSFLNECFIF